MHRNGVKVLGTFLIESHTPQIERMLQKQDGDFVVARQLAAMADAYGFDGWLLNIEGEFPRSIIGYRNALNGFIAGLKVMLGLAAKVVWYDALTSENKVDYQNGLTSKNLGYALKADKLFMNYKWTESKLIESERVADINGMSTADVCFGIDVWAQNTNMPGPSRITYPPKDGGGTNTGVVSGIHSFNAVMHDREHCIRAEIA